MDKAVIAVNARGETSVEFAFKKYTVDKGKSATTTVSTIEKDAEEVEQYNVDESFHKNIAIIRSEMKKRGVIRRKLKMEDDDEWVLEAEGTKRSRMTRGTLGIDSTQV